MTVLDPTNLVADLPLADLGIVVIEVSLPGRLNARRPERYNSSGVWLSIRTPYCREFVQDLKATILSHDAFTRLRMWDKTNKRWLVRRRDQRLVRALITRHFGVNDHAKAIATRWLSEDPMYGYALELTDALGNPVGLPGVVRRPGCDP